MRKIDEIEQYLQEIGDLMPESEDEYLNDLEKKRALERLLQIAIEAVMDTSAILVKELKLGLPSSEKDFLESIGGNVIGPVMVDKLKKFMVTRNMLVHDYSQVSDEQLFKILKEDIKDIYEFKKDIIDFLKKIRLKDVSVKKIEINNVSRILKDFQAKIEKDEDVLALILFGSYARGKKQGMWICAWFSSQIRSKKPLINGLNTLNGKNWTYRYSRICHYVSAPEF